MNRPLLLALAIILIGSASSCNFYRRITGKKKTAIADSASIVINDSLLNRRDSAFVKTDSSIGAPALADTTGQALLQSLLQHWNVQTAWNTFNGKAAVHFEGKGENRDFSAAIRMEKGRSIWVSVTALGLFEAARVLFKPDTIWIIDRINKEVRVIPFVESSTMLPIQTDFESLQALIIGDRLRTGNHQPTIAKDTATAFILSYIASDFSQGLQFEKRDTSLRFQSVESPTASMLCEYGNWIDASGRRFAANRNLSMSDKGERYILSLEFSKASFDEAIEQPFSIPEKYERK